MELFIRQEQREERQDVFTIYTIDKGLNDEKTAIIEVENKIKENTTKNELLKEVDTLQAQINELEVKKEELNAMITMIDNFPADV